MKKDNMAAMMPLFLVIAIDSMGLGILFPIMSSLLINSNSPFLSHATSMATREWLYGLVIGIYMIAWFFGAAMLGDLSDIIGRKRTLLICLIGSSVGYLIAGLAIVYHHIGMFVFGRVIAGFTAGSQPIAQAAIVDLSSEEHKARNISYILLISSLGFLLGPLLGGIFSDANLSHWFSYAAPMYVATIISLANILLLASYFRESFTRTRQVRFRVYYALQIFIEAFQHKGVRLLVIILFIFILAWSSYFGFISQFLIRRYGYSAFDVSLFITALASGFSVSLLFLIDYVSHHFKQRTCLLVSFLIVAISVSLTILIHQAIVAWIATVIAGASAAMGYSMLVTQASNEVDENEQGWVMGVTNSSMALAFGVSALIGGPLASLNDMMPLLLTVIGMILAAGILATQYQKPRKKSAR